MLTLQRDDPVPGVRGLKSWRLSGDLIEPTQLPEDARIEATVGDGRLLSGRALLTGHNIAVNRDVASVTYEYQGTGPLAGTTEGDYD